jgi:hypothetical protein
MIMYSREIQMSDEETIKQALKLDDLCYESDMRGQYTKALDRYKKNKDTIIFLMGERQNRVFDGCAVILPISKDLYFRVMETNQLYDNNIEADDIMDWEHANYALLLSVAIVEERRDGKAIIEMTEAIEDFIAEKKKENSSIIDIVSHAVTKDGEKLLGNIGFQKVREIDGGYKLMIRHLCGDLNGKR